MAKLPVAAIIAAIVFLLLTAAFAYLASMIPPHLLPPLLLLWLIGVLTAKAFGL